MFKITSELRESVRTRAGGRCECEGTNCRHHRNGSRCKRGLRGDEWKVYWHSEKAEDDPKNLEGWCLECFENNFTVPTHQVTLVRAEVADYTALAEEDPRRAVTLRAVLRDAGGTLAEERRGRVLDMIPDELWMEFSRPAEALNAARSLERRFHQYAAKLSLPAVPLCSGIHTGEIRRSRSGVIFGDALTIASMLERVASAGQIVISDSVAGALGTRVTLEGLGPLPSDELAEPMSAWVVRG